MTKSKEKHLEATPIALPKPDNRDPQFHLDITKKNYYACYPFNTKP